MTSHPKHTRPQPTDRQSPKLPEPPGRHEAPAVIHWGGARRVFGRGVNDINEWNDPC